MSELSKLERLQNMAEYDRAMQLLEKAQEEAEERAMIQDW